MTLAITLPCTSCGDPVSALVEFRGPVTLCGACTPEHWDGVSLPRGVYDWPALLQEPTHPMPYDDGEWFDFPLFTAGATSWDDLLTEEMRESERDALDRLAIVGDDGRDEFGELMDERAEPHREVA